MKNNKLVRLLCQAMIIVSMPSLSFADVTPLTTDSPDSCDKFNQVKSVIVVHAAGCPWAEGYVDDMSEVSTETNYQDWHYYELTFSLDKKDPNKTICGKTINNCPVTFIKNENGQDSDPLHGRLTKEQLKAALDQASSPTK